jgi:endonuclease YncB( thermonuclease family)
MWNVRKLRRPKELWAALSALVIAVVVYTATRPPALTPDVLVLPDNEMIAVTGALCGQPYECTFDVVGTSSVLGENIDVVILGYDAPRWEGAACEDEEWFGGQATNYLVELMNSSYVLLLIRPLKLDRDSRIYSHLYIDGMDVMYLMIAAGYAAPYGEEVDWCEKATKRLEASHKERASAQA